MTIARSVRRVLPFLPLIAVGAVPLSPRVAHACSALVCTEGSAIPTDNAVVPANGVGVVWIPPRTLQGSEPTLHLYRVDAAARNELEATLETQKDGFRVLRPKVALAEGTLLEASYDAQCSDGATTLRFPFRVGAAAPKPSTLGTLSVSVSTGDQTVGVSTGECSDQVLTSSARAALTLSAEAEPWAALLRYSLWADGEPAGQPSALPGSYLTQSTVVVGGSYLGRGIDRVDVLCEARQGVYANGLSEGSHRLQMVAILPDGSELRSDELTVDLRCPAGSDGGTPAALDGGAPTAAPVGAQPPSASGGSSAGDTGSASASSGTSSEAASAEQASGCALAPDSSGGAIPLWVLSLLLFLGSGWLGRRRRAAR